jgi:hypothetical protein
MSKNLKHCYQVLSLVAKVKDKRLREAILKQISCEEKIYAAVSELATNTIKGNIPLTEAQKNKLRKQKKFIEGLKCQKKGRLSKEGKKKFVEQSGGFLNVVLPIIATVLADLLMK